MSADSAWSRSTRRTPGRPANRGGRVSTYGSQTRSSTSGAASDSAATTSTAGDSRRSSMSAL